MRESLKSIVSICAVLFLSMELMKNNAPKRVTNATPVSVGTVFLGLPSSNEELVLLEIIASLVVASVVTAVGAAWKANRDRRDSQKI